MRLVELDMTKGAAILFVIFAHLFELTGANCQCPRLFGVAFNYSESVMLMFMLLSGYVYHAKETVMVDCLGKLKRLMVPYFQYVTFFTLTYFICYVLVGDIGLRQFLSNTVSNYAANCSYDYFTGTVRTNIMQYAVVPYWFVVQLSLSFLLFVPVMKMLEGKSPWTRVLAAVVLLAVSTVAEIWDPRGMLVTTYRSGVSYFTVTSNITGFAAILMIGTLLREYRILDIASHSRRTVAVVFLVCMVALVAHLFPREHMYAMQFGSWGKHGVWSLWTEPLFGFAMAYCVVCVCSLFKNFLPVRAVLSYIGVNVFDILMLHYGIAELCCKVFGFWQPVYHIDRYPAESFAWWHVVLVFALTFSVMFVFLEAKRRWILRRQQSK